MMVAKEHSIRLATNMNLETWKKNLSAKKQQHNTTFHVHSDVQNVMKAPNRLVTRDLRG